jgi:Lrp/AsnC family leucine-responsive transcriptional regulator
MKKLKPIDFEIISELIKNPRLSDRQAAKKLGISQPTVTRRRMELEKERLLDYTSIPDLAKLDFEILAITFGNRAVHPQQDFMERHPNLIFVSSGSGVGSDRVAISIHRNFSDYSMFMQDIRSQWGDLMEITDSFLVSLDSDNVLRPLSLRYVAECIEKQKS